MKHAGSLESMKDAQELLEVTPYSYALLCSPNFLRASYLDERTLTHESIVK